MKLNWPMSRRSLLTWLGTGAAGLVFAGQARAEVAPHGATPLPSFTGPGVNPYWNGVNPFVSYPQKLTFGAPTPEPAARTIIAYLKSHYTPETRER